MEPSLHYERFPAPPTTESFLEYVWLVRAPGFAKPHREILIPNGRPTLVVCLAEPGTRYDPVTDATAPNSTVIFGVITRPFVLEQLGPSAYLGAQLQPWGVSAFLPGRSLVDDFLRLDDWLGPQVVRRLEAETRAAAAENSADAARHVVRFLAERAIAPVPARHETLRHGVAAIERSSGGIAVAELARQLGYSTPSLYRLFRRSIGVSPKQYGEIIRYFQFTGSLLAGPARDSAALLSSLHGYYDQSHAARDFKRFTGVSASRFLEVTDGVARLMHANDSYKTPAGPAQHP